MANEEQYMKRCLELAALGLGSTAPNPMVGAVIVNNDKIIGEGYHQKFGGPHAEVNAFNDVEDHSLLKESVLYVNLEPCFHHGKTPPCTHLILQHEIPRITIGCLDPNPKVAGKSVEKLKEAGCTVAVNILRDECKLLNRRFLTYFEKERPYIILKWAETANGIFAPHNNMQKWITDNLSKKLVHKWRSEEMAVLVGTNTARIDNPHLTVREWNGRNPVRLVIDKELKLRRDLHLFDNNTPTIVFTSKDNSSAQNLEYIKIDFDQDMLDQILVHLYAKQIQSVMVEGGAMLLNSFIDVQLWDEARILVGNKTFNGIPAPEIDGKPISKDTVGDDRLLIYRAG